MNHILITLKSNFQYSILFVLGLLSPIKHLLILVGIFIIIDTILGIWNAKYKNIKLTSRKFSSILSKIFIYELIVILAYSMDINILGGLVNLVIDIPLFVTKMATLFLIINESYSIDEKIRSLNKEKGFWFYFKRAIGVAKSIKKETDEFKN